MSHNKTPKVSLSILFASLVLGIIISLISFYSYKSCPCSACSKPTAENSNTDTNSYVTMAGPNGDAVKVSSKLSGLAAYVANDSTASATNADNGFWKSKFKEWREKMSHDNVTPSFTNFMDIVELSKIVKQN
ncbi:MAG TPA: hypothetical protein VK718_06945 [Ferruginibacter sp.]|jgi:hypothetical protein|nr:hypothetical protein [Ferruginibacter sp.]